MNRLNLGSGDEPVVKKKSSTRNLKIALGLAAVILIPTIGSTLAGTITVGTSNTLEFAQGVTATTACSPTLTITPTTALASGAFVLGTIVVTGINAACSNKYLTFKVLDSSGTAQAIGTGGALFCRVQFILADPYTATANVGATCGTISAASATAFTLTPTTKPATTTVDKITIESGSTA